MPTHACTRMHFQCRCHPPHPAGVETLSRHIHACQGKDASSTSGSRGSPLPPNQPVEPRIHQPPHTWCAGFSLCRPPSPDSTHSLPLHPRGPSGGLWPQFPCSSSISHLRWFQSHRPSPAPKPLLSSWLSSVRGPPPWSCLLGPASNHRPTGSKRLSEQLFCLFLPDQSPRVSGRGAVLPACLG